MQILSTRTADSIWRTVVGPAADEVYIQCRPAPGLGPDIARQTDSIYRGLHSRLRREHGPAAQIVCETAYFRNIRRDCGRFREARMNIFQETGVEFPAPPATTFIEQPPLDTDADVVVSAFAVNPRRGTTAGQGFDSGLISRSFSLSDQKYLFAGNICGAAGGAFEQAYGMFCRAEETLASEGMSFRDVIRTWIYLREMERDYGEFNRARREFFLKHGVAVLPASTGISGSPLNPESDFTLAFSALRGSRPIEVSVMTTPTLNEAYTYGSDFSRGLRVVEANKVGVYVSGTASVDEEGRTAHPGSFSAQVERMLLNVETLLAAQQASFHDVVSAVTYLKSPGDAPAFQSILRERGLSDLPNVLVHAAVCRPDLLCEMEAVAALPVL